MELKIPANPDWDTLRRYLGGLDEETIRLSEILLRKLDDVCMPRETHREFAVERKGDGIYICGEKFEGRDIEKHLEGCERCILFSLTLGVRADSLLRTLESSDMGSAVVCDALASVVTEQLCEEASNQIKTDYKESYLTDRYSPGYGDLPLAANRSIEKLLDTQRRIGVSVTESFMLLPRKSVTAVIGISNAETNGHMADCRGCVIYDKCKLRREGKTCGKDI